MNQRCWSKAWFVFVLCWNPWSPYTTLWSRQEGLSYWKNWSAHQTLMKPLSRPKLLRCSTQWHPPMLMLLSLYTCAEWVRLVFLNYFYFTFKICRCSKDAKPPYFRGRLPIFVNILFHFDTQIWQPPYFWQVFWLWSSMQFWKPPYFLFESSLFSEC